MAVGGMFLWTNTHTHTLIQFCNKRPDEQVSCCSKTRQAPRDKGCMKQMGSVEKYCCSLRPKHTVCVCLFRRQCVTCRYAPAVCSVLTTSQLYCKTLGLNHKVTAFKCFKLLWLTVELLLVEGNHERLALIEGLRKPVGWKADPRKINKGSAWQAKWNLRHQQATEWVSEWVNEWASPSHASNYILTNSL